MKKLIKLKDSIDPRCLYCSYIKNIAYDMYNYLLSLKNLSTLYKDAHNELRAMYKKIKPYHHKLSEHNELVANLHEQYEEAQYLCPYCLDTEAFCLIANRISVRCLSDLFKINELSWGQTATAKVRDYVYTHHHLDSPHAQFIEHPQLKPFVHEYNQYITTISLHSTITHTHS